MALIARPAANQRVHPWRVLHASHDARSVSSLVDAQTLVGMRPYIMNDPSPGRSNASLLRTWADVRNWDRRFAETAPVEMVHCHLFAAGMAAVRGAVANVYDLRQFCDAQAVAQKQCPPNSWLARSFKAAEQFVLARAGAVITHSTVMKKACAERGVSHADLFMIPDTLPNLSHAGNPVWLRNTFGFEAGTVSFFAQCEAAPDSMPILGDICGLEGLLKGFALLHDEVEDVRLFIAAAGNPAAEIQRIACQLGIAEKVFVLLPQDADSALASADVVIATPYDRPAIGVNAQLHQRCLLAPDTSDFRDVTPHGRGCLWYAPNPPRRLPRDLANRAAFLARNPDFRRSLAESGHQHILSARSPEKRARLHDKAYRHAARKRSSGSGHAPAAIELKPALVA